MKFMKSDYEFGYRSGKAGYYDKWYRYNRKDDGAQYDRGFDEGRKVSKKENYIIIPITTQ